jgi:pyruvate/2-oxoglutarate dehydrogenase complex dihydrolipoamide acyltransferase (E2) component
MEQVAFAARSEELSGGTVNYGDGSTFDVVAGLSQNGGVIVVDGDTPLAYALDGFPGLKRTAVPNGAESVEEGRGPREAPEATPAAARKAQELGVDLSEVEGSGADGKITADDVAKAAESAPTGEES